MDEVVIKSIILLVHINLYKAVFEWPLLKFLSSSCEAQAKKNWGEKSSITAKLTHWGNEGWGEQSKHILGLQSLSNQFKAMCAMSSNGTWELF